MKDTFKGTILETKGDKKGHLIILMIESGGKYYILGNVYGYNSIFKELFENINSFTNKYPTANILLGGDFNMVWSNNLDRHPSRTNDRVNHLTF